MLERLLKRIVDDQVQRAVANPSYFQQFLADQGRLTAHEIAALVQHLTRRRPSVALHLPRKASPLPCYVIAMDSEQEGDRGDKGAYLGDFGGHMSDVEADVLGDPCLGGRERLVVHYHRFYSIDCYGIHPDNVLALYEFSKYILLRARDPLATAGVDIRQVSGQALELLDIDDWGPDHIYRRRLLVEANELFMGLGAAAEAITLPELSVVPLVQGCDLAAIQVYTVGVDAAEAGSVGGVGSVGGTGGAGGISDGLQFSLAEDALLRPQEPLLVRLSGARAQDDTLIVSASYEDPALSHQVLAAEVQRRGGGLYAVMPPSAGFPVGALTFSLLAQADTSITPLAHMTAMVTVYDMGADVSGPVCTELTPDVIEPSDALSFSVYDPAGIAEGRLGLTLWVDGHGYVLVDSGQPRNSARVELTQDTNFGIATYHVRASQDFPAGATLIYRVVMRDTLYNRSVYTSKAVTVREG